MTAHSPATASPMFQELSALGNLRVWSVIITIFGDAVHPRGGVVSAATLAAITERLGIKPEALRVALYRLAKDGWITRRKSGRNSFYDLSATGLAEFLPATKRIYAEAPQLRPPWRLLGLPPLAESERTTIEARLNQGGYIRLTPALFLGTRTCTKAPGRCILLEGNDLALPGWAKDAIAPKALQQDYAQLTRSLRHLQAALHKTSEIAALDQVALRILCVHQWRRLLLRHADLPVQAMPTGWQGETCRKLFIELHATLSRQADPWLDAAISG